MTNQSPKVGIKFKDKKPTLALKAITQKQDFEDVALKDKQEKEKQLIYGKQKKEKRAELDKLIQVLQEIFDEKEWTREALDNKHFIYKHKQKENHIIEIHKYKDRIKFSGNPIEKIVELAKAYEDEFGKMEYEIEASDLKTAIEFLNSLNQHDFEISKIKNLNLKSNEPYDLKKIINAIKKSPPSPMV